MCAKRCTNVTLVNTQHRGLPKEFPGTSFAKRGGMKRNRFAPPSLLLLLAMSSLGSLPGCGDPTDIPKNPTGGQGFEWPVDTYPISITPHASWKHQITFPDDIFLSAPSSASLDGGVRWVKFTVLMHDPTQVYFQDSYQYEFHAPFATERLDPFVGLSFDAFNDISLHASGQKAILGAVLLPPDPAKYAEYGIQLVRQDAYDPEMARIVLDLVKKNVLSSQQEAKPFYFPTYEQNASATQNQSFFTKAGFPVSSVDRWISRSQCYAGGWALGKLRYVAPEQIQTAYTNGSLKAEDILLTDAIPAELPYVAGIVSLSPSTPNAHTAILATSFGTPFVYLGTDAERERAKSLDGKEIILRAKNKDGVCTPMLANVDGALDPSDRTALLAQKKPDPLAVKPKQPLGKIVGNTNDLGPADVIHFGGKASNYGLLRDAIPDNSQDAIAFSFDLWDGFLDQTMPGGKTLRAEIAEKLAKHVFPPNLGALQVDLAAIRLRIEQDAVFSTDQQKAVTAALASFDPKRKIRFRSSTNVEDAEMFTGAGLYDSASGCLADDTDADTAGPSACDATQTVERGVFRALKKVYASFYNDNAFLARLLYGVKETDVGMGVLVHYSYPDEDELANGVATNIRGMEPMDDMNIVSQMGALSVTNPEGGAQPEVVHGYRYSWGTSYDTISGSSLVPLGGHVMEWDKDYIALGALLGKVADRFGEVNPAKPTFALDYEYKKVKSNGKLVIKQVRELPQASDLATLVPFMVPEAQKLCTFQGESSDVFAIHRLKVRTSLAPRAGFYDANRLTAETFFGDVTLTHASPKGANTFMGHPSTWPMFAHSFMADQAIDTFVWGAGAEARTFELSTAPFPTLLSPAMGPIVALRDMQVNLAADYATPVPFVDFDGLPAMRPRDEPVWLVPCSDESPETTSERPQTRTMETSGVKIVTTFHWGPAPTGIVAGYTAPLLRWKETTIEGLTTKPIVLKGFFSQTYRPQHHNFSEDFMFEPALEEGLSADVLNELEVKGIRQIYVLNSTVMGTIDSTGQLKPL